MNKIILSIFILLFSDLTYLNGQNLMPDDPYFSHQVSFYEGDLSSMNIDSVLLNRREGISLDAPRAWSLTTGSRSVVVALIDDGFFYNHEDLNGNIWTNSGETGYDADGRKMSENGRDDDGNGYRDDVMGWDFAFEDPDPDHYVFDGMDRSRIQPYWHSIYAMGIIGAKGDNGLGISGINWDVSMMLLKAGAQGTPRNQVDTARVERASRAIRYAVDNGAKVINWSGYVSIRDSLLLSPLKQAIDYAEEHGVLLVLAAGNDAKNIDNDENCVFPQCFENENIINVAQLSLDGSLYMYNIGGQIRGSNYGSNRVHIAAIGENFTTSLHHNISTYGISHGTSSAAPVVSGVAALILSVRPDLSATEIKQILLDSSKKMKSLKGKIESEGTVNAYQAINYALQFKQ